MIAHDGELIPYDDGTQQWALSWHPPAAEPDGKPHGANAFCVTVDSMVVLVSTDEERWFWPGGRPEGDESWEDTLRRECLEEACVTVTEATLVGFVKSACLRGHEEGLELVRSVWRAEVDVLSWEPEFEIPFRRLVPVAELSTQLFMEPGLEPVYERALSEAGLAL